MKIALCIIWILVSAGVFSKTLESEKFGWLGAPSMMSCVIAFVMWILYYYQAFHNKLNNSSAKLFTVC